MMKTRRWNNQLHPISPRSATTRASRSTSKIGIVSAASWWRVLPARHAQAADWRVIMVLEDRRRVGRVVVARFVGAPHRAQLEGRPAPQLARIPLPTDADVEVATTIAGAATRRCRDHCGRLRAEP